MTDATTKSVVDGHSGLFMDSKSTRQSCRSDRRRGECGGSVPHVRRVSSSRTRERPVDDRQSRQLASAVQTTGTLLTGPDEVMMKSSDPTEPCKHPKGLSEYRRGSRHSSPARGGALSDLPGGPRELSGDDDCPQPSSLKRAMSTESITYHRVNRLKENMRRDPVDSFGVEGSNSLNDLSRGDGGSLLDAPINKFKKAEGAGACICVCAAAKHSERERVQIKATREKLRSEFSRLRVLSKEVYDDKVVYEKRLRESEDNVAECRVREKYLEEQERRLTAYEDELTKKKRAFEEKSKSLSTRELEMKRQSHECQKMNDEARILHDESERMRRRVESEQDSHRQEYQSNRLKLDSERTQLKTDRAEFEKLRESLNHQENDLKNMSKLLDKKDMELECHRKQFNKMKAEVDDEKESLSVQRLQVDAAWVEIERQKEALESDHSSKLEELVFREGVVENHESEMSTLRTELDALQLSIEEKLKAVSDERSKFDHEVRMEKASLEEESIALKGELDKMVKVKEEDDKMVKVNQEEAKRLTDWKKELLEMEQLFEKRKLDEEFLVESSRSLEADRLEFSELQLSLKAREADLEQQEITLEESLLAAEYDRDRLEESLQAAKKREAELDEREKKLEENEGQMNSDAAREDWIREVKQSVRSKEEQVELQIHRSRIASERLERERENLTRQIRLESDRLAAREKELKAYESQLFKFEQHLTRESTATKGRGISESSRKSVGSGPEPSLVTSDTDGGNLWRGGASYLTTRPSLRMIPPLNAHHSRVGLQVYDVSLLPASSGRMTWDEDDFTSLIHAPCQVNDIPEDRCKPSSQQDTRGPGGEKALFGIEGREDDEADKSVLLPSSSPAAAYQVSDSPTIFETAFPQQSDLLDDLSTKQHCLPYSINDKSTKHHICLDDKSSNHSPLIELLTDQPARSTHLIQEKNMARPNMYDDQLSKRFYLTEDDDLERCSQPSTSTYQSENEWSDGSEVRSEVVTSGNDALLCENKAIGPSNLDINSGPVVGSSSSSSREGDTMMRRFWQREHTERSSSPTGIEVTTTEKRQLIKKHSMNPFDQDENLLQESITKELSIDVGVSCIDLLLKRSPRRPPSIAAERPLTEGLSALNDEISRLSSTLKKSVAEDGGD
eukprot:GHVH01001011.1.p1 GENE.GHVH01001011.1~~GHVH01001011.1.p1  ORF type:complete len:1236 (+),score=271.49 GHVH01001011.1:300-3710(+)